jgi:hypothetical protein
MKNAGIIIIVAGLLITIFTGVKFVTQKKVVDIGNLEITRDKNHYLTWSPFVGIAVLAVGAGVYFYAAKKQ